MAMTYKIDARHRMVFSTMDGVVSFEQVVAHAVALKSDDRFHPSFSQLVDLRGVTQADLSFEEVLELAHTIDPFSPSARRAVVAGSEMMYGRSHLYQSVRERGANFRVFRSMEDAQAWLGIADDSDAAERRSA